MKSKLKTFFNVSTLALLMAFTPAIAIAQGTDAENTNQTVQTTAVEEDENSPAQLKARLDKRKTDLKTKLDAAKQARLKLRCKASQGKLSSISGRIKGLETSRTQKYQNMLDRLNSISDKLATQGIDTTALNTQITELTELVTTFNTDLDAYKQAVADLALMDCAADPTAFQASLESARTARAKTAESAKAIRAYLTDEIKPALVTLKSQLGETTENDGTE